MRNTSMHQRRQPNNCWMSAEHPSRAGYLHLEGGFCFRNIRYAGIHRSSFFNRLVTDGLSSRPAIQTALGLRFRNNRHIFQGIAQGTQTGT